MIKEKKQALEKAPKGSINIVHSKNRTQYYHLNSSNDKKRTYIKKEKETLVRKLCQKDYDIKVLHAAEKEHKVLKALSELYAQGICEDVYENLHRVRKQFVMPITLSDEAFIEQWLSEDYKRKGFEHITH